MKVIEADHERRYEIPGVPGLARKPVDIDASKTGFTHLRSLRVYRFEAGAIIDGHAEEDEVFVVVTSGSVEMKIGWEDASREDVGTYTLTAPDGAMDMPFVAYLPPRSLYQLTPNTAADVAYARATPLETRSPAVFSTNGSVNGGVTTLLEEITHAEKLGLRILRVRAPAEDTDFDLMHGTDAGCEALVHVQGSPAENVCSISGPIGSSLSLHSWQTVVFSPGERAGLCVPQGADTLILMVLAA